MNKHKYFLRGFGTALILSASIFYITIGHSKEDVMSDQAIIDKAMTLGMIEDNQVIEPKKPTRAEIIDSAKEFGMAFEKDIELTVENKLREQLTIEIVKEIEAKYEKENPEDQENKKEEKQDSKIVTPEIPTTVTVTTENKEKDSQMQVELTIDSGMSSKDVAALLYDSGIVDDINKFDRYLMVHGYAQKIKTGTYYFNVNSSYGEAMKKFTNYVEIP